MKLKEGMAVEHVSVPGEKIVKMIHGNNVVIMNEAGELEIFFAGDLYPIPGDAYLELGEIVHHAVESVREQVSENFGRDDARIALIRRLYEGGVRPANPSVTTEVVINSDVISDAIARNFKTALKDYATEAHFAVMEAATSSVEHITPEGSETLVPKTSNEELAKMVCDVAETLWMCLGYPPINLRDELRHDIGEWNHKKDFRRQQVWQSAINIVSGCQPHVEGVESIVMDYYKNFLQVTASRAEPDEPQCSAPEDEACAPWEEEAAPAKTDAPKSRGKPVDTFAATTPRYQK